MGAMSQLYSERQAQLEHTDALRRELETAADRMHVMAKAVEVKELRELFTKWATEALDATRRL